MLIQQRALTKYHSGGLWANTCCSHPLPNEPLYHKAIHRRLNEELGMQCDMQTYWYDFYIMRKSRMILLSMSLIIFF